MTRYLSAVQFEWLSISCYSAVRMALNQLSAQLVQSHLRHEAEREQCATVQ